jgi:agmatinase
MRVMRSPYLYVEREDGEQITVREKLAGNRAVINRRTLALLDRFRALTEVPDGHPQLGRMLELGFLVEEGREARALDAKLFSRVRPTLFGCPDWRPGDKSDFVFLGIPADGGNRAAPGARYGPDALRQASAPYAALPSGDGGAVQGWIDHDAQAPILRGARLADAGDVFLSPGAAAEDGGRKISEAVAKVAASGCPVVLGGDHSLTFAALRGAVKAGAGLLHLDAHSDASWHMADRPHDYGNFVTRVLRELQVPRVVHVGVRGLGHAPLSQPPARLALPPGWLRGRSLADFLDCLDPERPWYVSIDIDVVDPAFAPGTATPVPGGLTVAETKALLRAVGAARRVVGVDLVEVNPHFDRNRVTATLGCELILTLLGAIWRDGR